MDPQRVWDWLVGPYGIDPRVESWPLVSDWRGPAIIAFACESAHPVPPLVGVMGSA